MFETVIGAVIAVIIAGAILHQILSFRRRKAKDYREHLEPMLAERGLTFVSAKYPGMFNVGPFPKIELRRGRPQSRVMGVSGEHNEYRIVEFTDAQGTSYRLWALLRFEVFRLTSVRWRAEPGAAVPEAMRDVVEA